MFTVETKICSKKDCKQANPQLLSEFRRNKAAKDCLNSWCKKCEAIVKTKWKVKNKSREQANLRYADIKRRKGDCERPSHQIERNFNKSNWTKEFRAEYAKNYRKMNADKLRYNASTYYVNKYRTDVNYRLASNLRGRIRKIVNRVARTGSAVKDLGCSIDEFQTYLESKFEPGMTWENHSQLGWHVDHIIPLSSFNLTDSEQFKKACHYTNLQPLWAKDNLKKSDKT